MHVRAGTSGFSYREWRGRFYPTGLPASKMLAFYASRFSTVEINHTFHGIPPPSLLRGWRSQSGPGLVFALKAPRRITHILRLKDVEAEVAELVGGVKALGKQLGPVLFQLPPNFKKDLGRLEALLALLPGRRRWAFEFRHPSWFDDSVFSLLRARRAALCLAEDEELATPWVVTAPFGYLRLRRMDYTPRDVRRWVKRVREAPWSEAFVFFRHEDGAKGPALATEFARLQSGYALKDS